MLPDSDGRRTQAAEAKRADNRRRATATGLIEEPLAFFNAGVLGDGASDQQRDVADALLQRARERAHHVSKDNRLGTALSKYEALCEILPDLRRASSTRGTSTPRSGTRSSSS